jgi:GT2 family glycosyltransferase
VSDISVCVAVYRQRPAPNVATLSRDLPLALGALQGELRVALNGISASVAGVGDDVVAAAFEANRGVSVAWNAAAAEAAGDVLCFCNDDVSLGAGSLERLHEALTSTADAGIVSPVGAGWNMRTLRYGEWVHPGGTEIVACDVVAGFLFALRRETFQRLGGFDEAYTPAGLEEVDLSTAIRRKLGQQAYAAGGIEHVHEYGISAARPWQRLEFDGRSESIAGIAHRNKQHFAAKWDVPMPRFDRLRYAAEVAALAVKRRLGRAG